MQRKQPNKNCSSNFLQESSERLCVPFLLECRLTGRGILPVSVRDLSRRRY
jgi:hypothetical protein